MGNMTAAQRLRLMGTAFRETVRNILGRGEKDRPIVDDSGLARFLRTRASHVTQTSLYGYLRARAGTRYPELFSDDEFLVSVNIAKWQVWLACLSDLAVYAGGLVCNRAQARPSEVRQLMQEVVDALLEDVGVPEEAGADFAEYRDRVRARIALCELGALPDDETAFAESPAALVYWAPVVEDYKQLDEEIVRNSIRFRWQEVRQELRRLLDAEAVMSAAAQAAKEKGDAPVDRA